MNPKNRFKAVLFDLDGTLLDTLQDLADSLNAILEAHQMEIVGLDDYRNFVGKGLSELIKCVLPKDKISSELIEEFLAAMKIEYAKRWSINTKPYPGIPELLDELQRNNIPITVLSNKADNFTKIIVETLLPNWNFAIVKGLTDDFPAKPDPASALQIACDLKIQPQEFLYLGDTDIDMQTANSAGMYAVGVLWGFRTAEELKANGAKILIESPLELMNLFNQ